MHTGFGLIRFCFFFFFSIMIVFGLEWRKNMFLLGPTEIISKA